MYKENNEIPIFFAVDDEYIPFLSVAIKSLVDNASDKNKYVIRVLCTNVNEENKNNIKKYEKNNISIDFVDLTHYIKTIENKLYTRDYFSLTTYFRLFLPELYPQYDKVLYLDSDIVILDDIAKLYNIELGANLVGGAPDDVMQSIDVFKNYAELVVGVKDYRTYFNAGILLMNLKELRGFKFQEKFTYLLETVKFSVAQDQDYLNRLCKGRVTLLDKNWNRMPVGGDIENREDLHLIHYNLAFKPWHFENVLFEEYFWKYANQTDDINKILEIKANFTEENKKQYSTGDKKLRELAQKECDCVGDDRMYNASSDVTNKIKKSSERLQIIEKIQKLEKEGIFDQDVEDDPPTIVLTPDKVDYLKTKSSSKIKSVIANQLAEKFFNDMLKNKKVLIKQVNGIESLENLKTGAVLTCNHFNPFDSFTVESIFRKTKIGKNKKLYKVIREGNYTNFPGFYGFLFRNCDTLPLSSNIKTMTDFMNAVDKILQRDEFILIYPEQSMWWNYRKPKPLKEGAFKIAIRNNVPIVPIFITMEDSDIIGEDGFPIQEYTVHIEEPIYADENLSKKENVEEMKNKNFEVWKEVYEEFYQIPLEYTTINKELVK